MARLFNGVSQFFWNGSAPVSTTPLTIAAWVWSDDLAADQAVVEVVDWDGASWYGYLLQLNGAGAGDSVLAKSMVGGVSTSAETTTGYSASTWHHVCGVFESSTARHAYIDGGSKGSDTTSSDPSGMDYTALGCWRKSSGTGGYLSGGLAEVAMWNVALSDAEIARLAMGIRPIYVRPQSIVRYWPLVGHLSTEVELINKESANPYYGPTTTSHPPIIYQVPAQVWSLEAATQSALVTAVGAYVEQDTSGTVRATQIGAYAEIRELGCTRITTVGAYVEITSLTVREKFLEPYVRPIIKAILRRIRLDFGDDLYHLDDEKAWGSDFGAGDDYYDAPEVLWGDSCVNNIQNTRMRMVSKAAWTSTGSTNLKASRSTQSVDDWSFVACNLAYVIKGHCRLGIAPFNEGGINEYYAMWHMRSDNKVYVSMLQYDSGWSWIQHSVAYTPTTVPDACAIHPVGMIGTEYVAILVGVKGNRLYTQWLSINATLTTWTVGSEITLRLDSEVEWSDCHWSDAEPLNSELNTYCLAVRISRWGSTRVYVYSEPFDNFSQGHELYPSQELFGNMRVLVSGMSTIYGRIWAVTSREIVGSDDLIYAPHVALCSTEDGVHWRDEYYVTNSCLRGKLLYVDSETYCHVVGNASVARAEATTRLGYDAPALKYALTEVDKFQHEVPGVSSALSLNLEALTVDTAVLPLLEPGNEVVLHLGAEDIDAYSWVLYATTMMHTAGRYRASGRDYLDLQCYGKMAGIMGDDSYRLPAARYYNTPYILFSRFISPEGNPILNVRQVSGTWVTLDLLKAATQVNKYVLHCSTAGVALIPYEFTSQSMFLRTRFQLKVSGQGFWNVFWYEDEDNYWRCGIELDTGTWYLKIQQVVDGEASDIGTPDSFTTPSLDTWYVLYFEIEPGIIRGLFKNSDSFDFSTYTASITHTMLSTDGPIPSGHHVGYEVSGYEGFEGAHTTGTVDSATAYTLTDTGASFGNLVGDWVSCNDQEREIASNTATVITLIMPWSEIPEVGESYGIYTAVLIAGPGAYLGEAFVGDGLLPWSVDDIVDNIMEMAGIDRHPVYTYTVGTRAVGPQFTRDLDLTLITTLKENQLVFWASATTESIWSGFKIHTYQDVARLYHVTYSPSTGQASVLLACHQLAFSNDAAVGISREFRVQAWGESVYLSLNGRVMTCFPIKGAWPSGYCWRISAGTAYVREFGSIEDGFIWDCNEPSSSAVERLLRERRGKMIEQPDGTIAVSRFEDGPLSDAGDYTFQQISIDQGNIGAEVVSLIEMVGAFDRAAYIDPGLARRRLRYQRLDSPMTEGQLETIMDAQRAASLAYQRSLPTKVQLHIADPELNLEHRVGVTEPDDTVTHYRTESVNFGISASVDKGPQVQASFSARKEDDITQSTFGQSRVLGIDIDPPVPTKGDRWMIGTGGAGAWSGHDDELTEWDGSNWIFEVCLEGTRCYVANETTWYKYISGTWSTDGSYTPDMYDGGWTYG